MRSWGRIRPRLRKVRGGRRIDSWNFDLTGAEKVMLKLRVFEMENICIYIQIYTILHM